MAVDWDKIDSKLEHSSTHQTGWRDDSNKTRVVAVRELPEVEKAGKEG